MILSLSLITPHSQLSKSWNRLIPWALFSAVLVLCDPGLASEKSPVRQLPHHEPELKIFYLNVSPSPYVISSGSLEFTIQIELPKELNNATLLEISVLITSPSKSSLRFLATRIPLNSHPTIATDAITAPRVLAVLSWDGQDQKKITAGPGLYHFEVRAKLFSQGENSPRTQRVSWSKRGTIDVQE